MPDDPDSKAKTLSDLLKELPSKDDIYMLFGKALSAEEYGAVMIATSLVDTSLRYLISSHLVPMGNDRTESIFGELGVLRTLSAKINMAYAMGLIGPETRSHIDRIRKIRNFFAHYTSKARFDQPEVTNEFTKMRTPKEWMNIPGSVSTMKFFRNYFDDTNPPKRRFVHHCNIICIDTNQYVEFKLRNDPSAHLPIEIY